MLCNVCYTHTHTRVHFHCGDKQKYEYWNIHVQARDNMYMWCTNMHDCGVRACTYTCSHFWTHTYTCAYTFRTVGTIRIACPDNTSACRKRIWIGCVPTMAPAFRPGRPRIRASFLLAIVHILVLSSGSRTVNGTTYIRISCMHARNLRPTWHGGPGESA